MCAGRDSPASASDAALRAAQRPYRGGAPRPARQGATRQDDAGAGAPNGARASPGAGDALGLRARTRVGARHHEETGRASGVLRRSYKAPAGLFRFTGLRSEGSRRRMGARWRRLVSQPPSDTLPRRGRCGQSALPVNPAVASGSGVVCAAIVQPRPVAGADGP